MNPDPFEDFIKTSPRGSPNVAIKSSQSNNDPFVSFIKQNPQEAQETQKRKLSDLNWFERNFTTEGNLAAAENNRNFLKSIISGSTAGFSEYFDPLKVDFEQEKSSVGHLTGALLPIGLTYKGIGLGFNLLKNTFKFGPKATTSLELIHQGLTGATYGATKQVAGMTQGKEFDPYAPLVEGAEFAAFGALLHGLVKYFPPAKEWVKSLTKNQASDFVKGILPENLTPNQYKFWQDEVAPEWLESSKKSYKDASSKAEKAATEKYTQDNQIAKANHEKELYEAELANNLSKESYEDSVRKYENNLERNMKDHEAKTREIQTENERMTQEYEEATESFRQLRAREAAVENSTRLRSGEENLPYRPSPNNMENPSLLNEAGNIISSNEAVNSTNAGRATVEAVRANDAIDYRAVNEAYTLSDELSSNVSDIHTNLVQQLETKAAEIRNIPHPSAPEKQLLQAIEDILKRLRTVSESGSITGFLEVDNHLLHEQAKSLRYVMDFTFEHGNTKGIFGQTVRQLEEAAELAARNQGNDAAAEGNVNARRLYREWANDYNNDYMRPYRDTSNRDYSGMFKRAANSTDEFNALNNILSRSNSGQQLSSVTKRAAVETRLGKFLENPHQANGRDFEIALRELGAVITPDEANAIRGVFNRGRSQPEPITKQPKPPSLKKIPEENLPEFTKSPPRRKEITTAKIARRKLEETPEMKIAAQEMNKKPEEIRNMADYPSGIKQLQKNTSKDVFKKIGQQRMREIIYEGQISPGKVSGKRVAEVLNKGDNYEIISEFIGENETKELLEAAQKISDADFTKQNIIKYAKKVAFLKTLTTFGVL